MNDKGFLPPWAQYVAIGFGVVMATFNCYLVWLNIREKRLSIREKRRAAEKAREDGSPIIRPTTEEVARFVDDEWKRFVDDGCPSMTGIMHDSMEELAMIPN